MSSSLSARTVVMNALVSVGVHPNVPITVTAVEVDAGAPPHVRLALELHYRVASPVCCGEPGCYVGFLGSHLGRVPEALRVALALRGTPRVTMLVTARHEAGYRHSQLDFGPPSDSLMTFPPERFSREN